MPKPQRHTVRVGADHSVVLSNPAWVPGKTVDVMVIEDDSQSEAAYSALLTLEALALDTPEDFSTSYEALIKQHG
jgi:hypothetical protein